MYGPNGNTDSLAQLRRKLRRREVSAVELAKHSLSLVRGAGHALNAVAEVTEEQAMAQASEADRQLAAGTGGPLCGIPWGPKDLLATSGIPTRWGAPPYADQVFTYDATVVRRIAEAGAVMVAKLAMIEMAGAGLYRRPNASINGPCRNPWDPSRWAGGSSSGSASAVAAGLVSFSIGSETGGSLVVPAAFCGITALRPSYGVVSSHGSLRLAWTMDKLGPMSHTASDCALILSVIAGLDELDPSTVPYMYRRVRLRPLRIGVLRQESSDPDVNAAFEEALRVLSSTGMQVRDVDLPTFDIVGVFDGIFGGEIAAEHEEFIRGPGLASLIDEAQKTTLAGYLERSSTAYPQATMARAAAVRAVRGLFNEVDALVAPTVLTEAIDLEADVLAYIGRMGGNTLLGAIAGLPEMTLPMGVGSSGLPVGLSIIGDLYRDAVVVRVGELFQKETSWHRRHPTPSIGQA